MKRRCVAGIDNDAAKGGGFFVDGLQKVYDGQYDYDRCRRPEGHERNKYDPLHAWHFPDYGGAFHQSADGELISVFTREWIEWYKIVQQIDNWDTKEEGKNVSNNVKTNNETTRKYGVQASVMRAIEANGMKITYCDDLERQLGITKQQVQSAINHIIKRGTPGHCIEVVSRGKIWRWNPDNPTRMNDVTADTAAAVERATRSTIVVDDLSSAQATARPFDHVELPTLKIMHETKNGSLLCEDQGGDLWIARKI